MEIPVNPHHQPNRPILPDTQRVGVIIPAAGQARRFTSGNNKIWAELAGRSLLQHVLAVFETHPRVGTIVVVAGATERDAVEDVAKDYKKVHRVVVGGATRAESVYQGLEALPAACEYVLVHDAARPLVSFALIERVLEATLRFGAAVPGLPLSDTVKRVDGEGFVRATVPRTVRTAEGTLGGLTAVQTPQGARVELLRRAYAHWAFQDGEPTDEASLIEALGEPVAVVEGDFFNIKITRPEDLPRAEQFYALLHSQAEEKMMPERHDVEMSLCYRTGFGYDVHAFAEPQSGRKLVLGGVEIPHTRGLEGHSDADVLLHAICDALLGAASLGDIGILFPNTDPAYRNISSLKLLEAVRDRLQEAGWQIENVDATLVAEAPKLRPYRERIQHTIADCLRIAPARVSVKATTNERMGFIGREEGIACSAVATLRRSLS
ncbi:MAG TPA: 2-C-methyl-D-erythritol 4-phosphate cytidylyltransferase [Chthonomonas sp.]|uniref:2-C-methyl-D-erythritol 4-phosphate cytidylyltransferase n=1 Tax=Chthonomonas sp. TaxID=2282153 RepID=UPI002B4AC4DD|nr:2-C-methyl-D-erythritol 4-phosphate cytidylyltransferase [Chthonomonas sp.]HLH81435.1 2-C-methyl-D-erythritol 4-phosphate cytidylyltransferase [Chthonomonas sp.]